MKLLPTGTMVLERYRVVGPMPNWYDGAVLARDERLGQDVDLVLAPAKIGTPSGDLFARRAQILGTLPHASLPTVCDVASFDDRPVLVQRHIPGRRLAQLLDSLDKLPTPVGSLRMIADVAEALDCAHARGLCHGAFGANSLLIDDQDRAVIYNLVWPYGDGPIPTVPAAADVLALEAVCDLLLRTTAPRNRAQIRAELASELRRNATGQSNRQVQSAGDFSRAIANIMARHEAEDELPRIARGSMAPVGYSVPKQPVHTAARPMAPASYSRRYPAPHRPSKVNRRGGNSWALALLAGTMLPLGVLAAAHHGHGLLQFGSWPRDQQIRIPWSDNNQEFGGPWSHNGDGDGDRGNGWPFESH